MVRVPVVEPRAHVLGDAQEAAMLAGAVVIDAPRATAGPGRALVGHAIRQGRAADQRILGHAEPAEPVLDQRHLEGLRVMGRAGQRDMLIRQAERVGRAGFHQRHRLEGLQRGTRRRCPARIAPGMAERTGSVSHRDDPVMQAFDHRPAPDASELHELRTLRHGLPPVARAVYRDERLTPQAGGRGGFVGLA